MAFEYFFWFFYGWAGGLTAMFRSMEFMTLYDIPDIFLIPMVWTIPKRFQRDARKRESSHTNVCRIDEVQMLTNSNRDLTGIGLDLFRIGFCYPRTWIAFEIVFLIWKYRRRLKVIPRHFACEDHGITWFVIDEVEELGSVSPGSRACEY
jgi:hypothetical protein